MEKLFTYKIDDSVVEALGRLADAYSCVKEMNETGTSIEDDRNTLLWLIQEAMGSVAVRDYANIHGEE